MNAAVCASVSSTTSIAVVAWFPWSSVVLSADAGHSSWEVIQTNMYLSNTLPFQGQLYGFLQSSSLGDRALFVSLDRCLSVSANNLPSISSNSIYLTVSLPDPVVVHCLSSRSFERPTALCQVHDGKEMICPSVRPFTLADHLLTYCNRHEWSNGLMFHEYYSIPESFQGLWKKIRTQDSQVRISCMRD
ncbi:hypothetical protein VPH35_080209 [Triticum aestivum]